jgi:hypothetical protein
MVCVESPRGRPNLSFMSNLDLEAYINNIIDRTQRVLTIQHRNLLRADRSFECPFRLQTNAQRLACKQMHKDWLTGTVTRFKED